jgi:hypothetical protein
MDDLELARPTPLRDQMIQKQSNDQSLLRLYTLDGSFPSSRMFIQVHSAA